jgi:hypothetical protein
MSKKPTTGGEVDAYCTKCKMDLNHRIVAMEGDTIRRVECLTCRGQHNYRLPKSADPPTKKKAAKKRATKAAATRARTTALEAAAALQREWEAATLGHKPRDFTAYRVTETLAPGQLLSHKKFGDGAVTELVEGSKVLVLFESGVKLLVHGR